MMSIRLLQVIFSYFPQYSQPIFSSEIILKLYYILGIREL